MPSPAEPFLSIEGAVLHPFRLGVADLAREPGGVPNAGVLVSGKTGKAVPLGPLLLRAGPVPGATHATAHAADGSAVSLPLPVLASAWVAFDLPVGKGGPLRLLVPAVARADHREIDDCAHVKQFTRLVLTAGPDLAAEAAHRAQHARKGH